MALKHRLSDSKAPCPESHSIFPLCFLSLRSFQREVGGGGDDSDFEILFHQAVSGMLASRHDQEYSSRYLKNIITSQSSGASYNLFKRVGISILETKTWWFKEGINLPRAMRLIKLGSQPTLCGHKVSFLYLCLSSEE